MPNNNDIAFWQEQLKQHRANLQKQKGQQATYELGGQRLALLNQIEASEEAIRESKAKLRDLGKEPEPSTIDPPEKFAPFPDYILKSYPQPIAQACANFNKEQEIGRKFIILDCLITHLIKYLAAIFIGQARRDKPDDYPLPEKLEWIANPMLENWTEAIFEISQLYRTAPLKDKFKLNDLLYACTRSLLGSQELIYAIDYLTKNLDKSGIDKPSVIDFLRLLACYRDRTWQDGAAQYPIEEAESLMLRLQPALIVLLNELEVLQNYPLVHTERVDEVESEKWIRLVKFMGQFTEDLHLSNKPPIKLTRDEAHHIKRGRFFIANSEELPELDLHPFFVLYRWELYALKHHEPTNFIEFRSCSRGTSLQMPPEAKSFFTTWLDKQPEEEEAEEVPPVLGEDENWYDKVEEVPSDYELESIPFTWLNAEGKQALEIALGEALRIGRFWLGIEFLMMALTKQEDRPLSNLFREIGISRGQFRGILRGNVSIVTKEDWRSKNVVELGAQALPNVRPADPDTLASNFQADEEQSPVMTPRMVQILNEARKIAGENQIGHIHLLMAALHHFQSPAVNLLFGIAAEAGWEPNKMQEWIIDHAEQDEQFPHEPADRGASPRSPFSPQSPASPGKGLLAKFGRDLNAEARAGKIHAAIVVDGILRQMKRILIQRETNNPLLIGEAGVGKTAIVEGLAYELVYGKPGIEALQNKRIIELSINSLVAGTKYRGELEERIDRIIAEVKASPDVIVFIDEIYTVLGGGSDSLSNIANALKPALARGEFQCIGATTINEYRQYIEKDPALKRRFETILVEEPSIEDSINIVAGVSKKIEEHHNKTINKSAVVAAVRLSARYIQDERLPAKAIKLLEQAAAYVRLPSFFGEPDDKKDDSQLIFTEVNEDLIRYLLSKKTGIPLERLTGDKLDRIKDIENILKSQVIGQDEAVKEISQAIKRSYIQLRDLQRPVGVFLFVGPTGVGKTKLARSLADFLFNDRDAIIRLDMSEYMEKHQVSRLIGAPPGYVGYEEEGQLTGRLRLKPFSVVLLDEIEKAHEDVHNLFLQLFDEGRLTDARGRTVSGREAIFIMTSNIGSELYFQDSAGFTSMSNSDPAWLEGKRKDVEKAIHVKFKPEFLNRVDRIIHFNPLLPVDIAKIFDIQINSFTEQLKKQHQVELEFAPEAVAFVCQKEYDPLNGARPLKRAIDQLIIEPLTDMILAGKIEANDKIVAKLTGSQITFEKE